MVAAHPRSRGENEVIKVHASSFHGSSPLTRGKLPLGQVRVCDLGLIPAHAGKTHLRRCAGRQEQAHPRSRGENGVARLACRMRTGSSPLTRGKPRRPDFETAPKRLIPAHAGKTARPSPLSSTATAHPRSRGENPGGTLLGRNRAGLIPAHAGKTRLSRSAGRRPTAHPRSRGENTLALQSLRCLDGSSPLTRGKLADFFADPLGSGLIPAHAGKTPPVRSRSSGRQAHPRSRGENRVSAKAGTLGYGSSPLTRGKHVPII